jgi:hypothetical protein
MHSTTMLEKSGMHLPQHLHLGVEALEGGDNLLLLRATWEVSHSTAYRVPLRSRHFRARSFVHCTTYCISLNQNRKECRYEVFLQWPKDPDFSAAEAILLGKVVLPKVWPKPANESVALKETCSLSVGDGLPRRLQKPAGVAFDVFQLDTRFAAYFLRMWLAVGDKLNDVPERYGHVGGSIATVVYQSPDKLLPKRSARNVQRFDVRNRVIEAGCVTEHPVLFRSRRNAECDAL